MKLSEAILLGSIGSKQGFGAESIYKESKDKCALGAALLAVGIEVSKDHEKLGLISPYHYITMKWPFTSSPVMHPITKVPADIRYVIFNLNDMYKWTRPQIAAWVAIQEAYDVTPHEVSACPSKMTLLRPSEPLVDLEPVDQTI